MTLKLTSPAFDDGQAIPRQYTCDGDDISPALNWEGLPDGTASLALIVDDPDAPGGDWIHWLVFNIPPGTNSLPQNAPDSDAPAGGGIQGNNSWKRADYGGPCPPSGTHRYFFRLYALDTMLDLKPGITRLQLTRAMEGHILGQGQLMGTYKRS